MYSFNVQLSPILRCSLTFLTPLHFRTNKPVDFISAPHPLEWPSGNSIEWPSTDWPKMVLLFMLNLLLSTGLDVLIFFNFTAIPIASFSTYQEAWIFEHLLISRWQPPLNHPFITKILTLKASGWLVQYKKHSQTFPSIPEGNRLFQRLRRRLTTKGVPPSIHCKQAQAWNILFELTSPGRLSFDTARTLRSGKFDDWEIYVLYRHL